MNGSQASQRLAAAARHLLRCSAFGSVRDQQVMMDADVQCCVDHCLAVQC